MGRYGIDSLSQFIVGVAIVLTLLGFFTGWSILSTVALVLLILSLFRCYSKNLAQRSKENDTFQRLIEQPKRYLAVARKAWVNRKTTRYFKCKNCGTFLSVPRGKGKLRVTCPTCHEQSQRKS